MTLKALSSAEREVDTQVRALLARNKLSRKDAQKLLDKFGARLQKERTKTLKEMQAGIKKLQAQVRRGAEEPQPCRRRRRRAGPGDTQHPQPA